MTNTHSTSTADYPIREERLIEERRFVCPFAFNELVAIVDDAGQDTGQRARFVAIEVDFFNWATGKYHVSIVGGINKMIDPRYLKSVKH